MLAAIGASSIDELFDVPAGVRLDRDLDLPDGLREAEGYERARGLARGDRRARAAPSAPSTSPTASARPRSTNGCGRSPGATPMPSPRSASSAPACTTTTH